MLRLSGATEAAKAAGDTEIEKLHAKIGQLVVERDFLSRGSRDERRATAADDRAGACQPVDRGAVPGPLHIPPPWTPARGGQPAGTSTARVENANAAARIQPRREGYYNAIQVYPWSDGALYEVYAAVGQITDIALEPGESLTGAGPIAAGDTARWIIGDTTSGSGDTRRVHVLVKPTRADLATNLVITTDRLLYMIELHAGERPYMPSVAWSYPAPPSSQQPVVPATPVIPAAAERTYRYALTGDAPPWRPVAVYDEPQRQAATRRQPSGIPVSLRFTTVSTQSPPEGGNDFLRRHGPKEECRLSRSEGRERTLWTRHAANSTGRMMDWAIHSEPSHKQRHLP